MGPINPWKLTGFKAGQNVKCTVVQSEPGGYAVSIQSGKDFLPAFLPTQSNLRVGEEVLAQFIRVQDHRILLSPLFNNTIPKVSKHQAIRWEEHLDEIDRPQADDYRYANNLDVTPVKTVPVAPPSPEAEAELAFNIYAQSMVPRKFRLKRAIDLILPPVDPSTLSTFNMVDNELEWLITDLEGGMRTGCVKASSEERLSRSAMLLFRGRAVGCIYGCKTMPETQPTKESLELMLADLAVPSTNVQLYDLPEDITLAMSALFLGYPVPRNDQYGARAYMDYICNWFAEKKQTACLAITFSKAGTCLGFIYDGKFAGAFYVENQEFSTEIDFVHQLLENDPQSNVEASLLPPEMTSSSVRSKFGYSLSMVKKQHG